jgi:hypothetical protein
MSSVSQRLTTLERLAGDAGGQELPSLVYFTGCTSTDTTPDKHAAFKRYKEQWQDDSRYSQILRPMQGFNDFKSYLEAHGQANCIVQVSFAVKLNKPTEATL